MITITVDVLPYLRPPNILKKWRAKAEIRTLTLRARGTQYSRLRQTKRRIRLRHMLNALREMPCECRISIMMKHGEAHTEGTVIVRHRQSRAKIEKQVRLAEAYAERTAHKYDNSLYGLSFIIKGGKKTFIELL